MEIRAKCKYDFESIKALTHLVMFKKADPKKRLTLWTVAYAVLFVFIIFEIVVFDSDKFLLVLLGVGVVFLALLYFWYFGIPKVQYR
jgi:hypothetical protein